MNEEIVTQLELPIKELDTSLYVYKSHNLIESGYNFTLNEQRLTYLASKKLKPLYVNSNIKPSDMNTYLAHKTFRNLRIYVSEFKDAFNLKSKSLYEKLRDTAASLKRKQIQYYQDDGSFVEKSWVITSKYNEEGKYVELTFHPELILDLLVLKGRFGRMNFEATKYFRSSYSFRFYELLQNYAYRGWREFELEDLKYKLGISNTLYTKYHDFKKTVINPALKEINSYSNLDVSFTEKRKGRRIEVIRFEIFQKNKRIQTQIDDDTITSEQITKMSEIVGIELTSRQVSQITNLAIESIKENKIDMSFYDYIKFEVNVVKNISQKTTVKNYLGCLLTAIKQYWKEDLEISKQLKFNNFEPREYDYDMLERKLLGWDKD